MSEKEIERIVREYKDAVKRIRAELLSMDLTDMSRTVTAAALAEVAEILTELSEESASWVAENIPEVAQRSVAETLIVLNVVETLEEAEKVATFSKINRNLVNAIIEDTQADLLAVTQNIDRRVRATVQRVAADSMRENMAAGVNGRKTISRDILQRMRADLGKAVDTGIIDSAGRRWKPEVYVDMVVRTKMAATARDVRINEALNREVMYGRISSHGATDACRRYEGMVVKLTSTAPGDYPYIGDLPRNEIFHPNCRHTVVPVRDPENLTGNERIIDEEKRKLYNVRKDIREGRIKKEINQEMQNRHIVGTSEYNNRVEVALRLNKLHEKPSILTLDANLLIEKYAGKSNIIVTKNGSVIEQFKHSEVIGYVNGDVDRPTKYGSIRYRKTGTHIVPYTPIKER